VGGLVERFHTRCWQRKKVWLPRGELEREKMSVLDREMSVLGLLGGDFSGEERVLSQW
jgi:hypothetical protein